MSKYELLQWKFTACQYNIEGSNGFNTFSMSEGLTADDKADLCRKAGSYTPPDGLPFTPTQEEIKTLFPVVFSSFQLRSGKHAVVQTVYVGQSYAENRWGNFFSHALISPSDLLPFYPIQLFNSPLFKSGLTIEELQINTTPPLLSPIEMDEANLRDFSTELPQFLGDDPSRSKILTSLLAAVRDGHRSGKPLILRDSPNNIPLWLAAIQYAFPTRLAGEITFTTYVHALSHGERFHITTTTDKSLQIDSPTMSATNHVFDFASGSFPAIPAKSNLFINEIKCDEPQYPGRDMRTIQRFLQTLRCKIADDSIEKSIVLYKFLEWNTPLSNQALQAILDFCFQQDITVRQQFVSKILQKEHIYDVDTLEMLLPKLWKIILESKSNDFVKLFYDFFVKQFENNVAPFGWSDGSSRFGVIDHFLEKHGGGVGVKLLEYVNCLVKQTADAEKYVCLHYALNLCLYCRDSSHFCEEIEVSPLSRLEKRKLEQFFNQSLDFVVSKSFSAEIHKHTVGILTKKCGHDASIVQYYLRLITKYGGTDQWKYGKPAKEQGTAFAKYVFNDATDAEWNMWLGGWPPPPSKPYHKTWSGKIFSTNQLWSIFDINVYTRGTSALEKKKKWEHLLNIRKMLEALASSTKGKKRLKFMSIPTWMDIWGNFVLYAIMASIVIVSIGLLIFLFAGRSSSDQVLDPILSEQATNDTNDVPLNQPTKSATPAENKTQDKPAPDGKNPTETKKSQLSNSVVKSENDTKPNPDDVKPVRADISDPDGNNTDSKNEDSLESESPANTLVEPSESETSVKLTFPENTPNMP